MNTQRLSALPAQVDLQGLPAAHLRAVLLAFSSPEAAEIFDAQLADLHAEWLAARERSRLRAAWIGLGIRMHLLTCAAYYACVALGIPALRTAVIMGVAAYITFGMFYGIATLIAPKHMQKIEAHKMPEWQMTRLAPPNPPPRTDFPVLPDRPRIQREDPGVPSVIVIPPGRGTRDEGDEPGGGLAGPIPGLVDPIAPPTPPSNTFCLPLVRSEPDYPNAALRRRIEGEVVVEVAIDRTGSVSGATVLQSSPAGVFDDAVLRAVRRWRYRVSGTSDDAGCDHAQVRLRFELPPGTR